jgi:DNA polymerase IIIc chi subunit
VPELLNSLVRVDPKEEQCRAAYRTYLEMTDVIRDDDDSDDEYNGRLKYFEYEGYKSILTTR